jgi:hypothetical protein
MASRRMIRTGGELSGMRALSDRRLGVACSHP